MRGLEEELGVGEVAPVADCYYRPDEGGHHPPGLNCEVELRVVDVPDGKPDQETRDAVPVQVLAVVE